MEEVEKQKILEQFVNNFQIMDISDSFEDKTASEYYCLFCGALIKEECCCDLDMDEELPDDIYTER